MINKAEEKVNIPKKVRQAIIDVCDDIEAMIGCAIDDDGKVGSFDRLNEKRIKIIRKFLESHE